jgi:hypothetical protein
VVSPASKAAIDRRYLARLRARVGDAFFAGGDAWCYGCGANHGTPVEFAHRYPTGLSGMGRGATHRLRDILAHPWAYVPLCVRCHRAWGGPERWDS